MSDSVARCILLGFKITSVLSRIIYHIIESMCEFAVSILQRYIYVGEKNVNFKVAKEINQRKRKSAKLIDQSQNAEEPKHKNVYCKTNESTMSTSIDMAKDMLTISEQRFCFHGTNKIMECNLRDARKVTVSFEFYPSRNRSMIEFFDSSSHGGPDPQKEMEENDDSSEKPKMSPDPKEENVQINQNKITKNECIFKYKVESKLTDETTFNIDSNMHATKNALEIASDGRNVSINECGAPCKKDNDSFSDDQRFESSVAHLAQDPESLVDNSVTHKQDSLHSSDKQCPDNDTVDKTQILEISFDPSCDKHDSIILVHEGKKATTTADRKLIPAIETDKKTKLEGPTKINNKHVKTNKKSKRSVQSPETNKDKSLLVPGTHKTLTPESPGNNDSKSVHAADKIPIPPNEADEKPVSASAVDKKSKPECPAKNDKKLVFVHTTDKKSTQEILASKDEKLVLEPISQKNESSPPVSLANQKAISETLVDKINRTIPESTIDKHIPASTIDGKPIPATGDCYPAENVSKITEKLREINEDNSHSSLTKKFGSQTEPKDTDGYDEEFSGDFNEMLEKGPSIVIGPDNFLLPNKRAYNSGNSRPDDSKIEMNSKYREDGWDDSDKYFLDYVIGREKEMGHFDPSDFKNECSNEMARCDENKNKDENIWRDSHIYGKIIDNYNPLTEVPKYYDLISVVDCKYILKKSRVKCYKKKEVIDNFASA